MVEYGGAINNGPAGQVAGSGGANAPHFGGSGDLFAPVSHFVNDATHWIGSLPFEVQVAGIIVIFLGLMVFRRAF